MRNRSVIDDAQDVQRATVLVQLGARLQVLESETQLSRERLLRLYKEIKGKSPPKGQLPFSTDWFITWMPNIHASLYMGIYQSLIQSSELDRIVAIVKAYQLYVEHCTTSELDVALSITRAWRLVAFLEANMLRRTACTKCGGLFIMRSDDLATNYVCGLCHMPTRAGKTKARMMQSECLSSSHVH